MISLICGIIEKQQQKNQLIDTGQLVEARVGRGVGKTGEGHQKVQISSYKIVKSWGHKVQHGDYS